MVAYFYISSATIRDAVNASITNTDTPSKAFPGRDSINLLLLGRDLDRDNRGRVIHTKGRTDAIMLAHVDFRNRQVSILSIPRDTLVHIPGYRGKRRMNSANALGGPELTKDTVEELVGVHPDYYMLVNFEGFEKAIDTMGGLSIDVDKQLDYDDNWGNLHIHLKPGQQQLNGYQSMGFVRYRKSKDGDAETDLIRIGRQQKFLCAVKSKLSHPSVMVRIPKILDTIRDDTEGDLSPCQTMCVARFMKSIPGGSEIKMETLPSLETGGNYVHADTDAVRELVGRMFLHATVN